MKTSALIGLTILLVVWIWLSWQILAVGGLNLKNLLMVAMSGIIIFVPLYKKWLKSDEKS